MILPPSEAYFSQIPKFKRHALWTRNLIDLESERPQCIVGVFINNFTEVCLRHISIHATERILAGERILFILRDDGATCRGDLYASIVQKGEYLQVLWSGGHTIHNLSSTTMVSAFTN
jgi:hypothetical protein